MTYRLHPDLVAAVRAAWEPVTLARTRRRLPALAGALYWDSEDGRPVFITAADLTRVRHLAARLGYRGPLIDREREKGPEATR